MVAIAVTGFERVSDVRTNARAAVEWPQLVARLSQHDRRQHKDGPGWAPAIFREPCTCGGEKCPGAGGHRVDANVLELHALVFDLDKKKNPRYPGKQANGKPEPTGIPLDEATAWAALQRLEDLGIRRVVHTTHSHNPADGKWSLRVVIALSRAVAAEQWERFWRAAVRSIGIHVEPSCFNPARFWFAPSAPPDAEPWSRSYDGTALDVEAVLADAEPEPAPPPPRRSTTRAPRAADFDIYRFVAETYPGSRPMTMPGGGMRWEIECPWEAEHSSKSPRDTMISIGADGKPGFSCLHDHCADRDWTAFRTFHDPEYAERKERARTRATTPGDDLSRARARKQERDRGDRIAAETGALPLMPGEQLPLRHAGIGPEGGYRCTDLGNARRFADMHGDRMRYVHAWNQWIVWDGKRWRRDGLGTDSEAAKQVNAAIYADAGRVMASAAAAINAGGSVGPTYAEALVKWASKTAAAGRLAAMIQLARSEPEIATSRDAFDRDPWLMNVRNGTLDLRDGEIRAHRQSDMLTMLSDVEYDPNATAPEWEKFLTQVIPDPEVRDWTQRYLGYSLTGLVSEQKFAFWVGKGGNGKNVCADVVIAAMGEYAMVGAPDLLLEKHGEAHPTELADIEGKRLVVCSEIEPGRSWAEARIKQITGDRTIKARRMKQDFYEFEATGKLVVLANTKPKVRSTDNGLWRRMCLQPWTVQIPRPEQDKGLLARIIEDELPGVLAYLVRGCLAWQDRGLAEPKAIVTATAEYQRNEDVLALWIADRCRLGGDYSESSQKLHEDYKSWCKDEGIDRPWTLKSFVGRLAEKDGIYRTSTGTARGLKGIRLLEQWEYPDGL